MNYEKVELNKETLASGARLLITIIAGVAMTFGWKFDAELWFNLIMTAVTVFLAVKELWWKNQNITVAAQIAQRLLNGLKSGDVVEADIALDPELDKE